MDAHLAFTRFSGKRLHLGVCGSVAAFKSLECIRQCRDAGFDVGATLTESAQRFITPLSFAALGASPVYSALFPRQGDDPDCDAFPHLWPATSAHCYAIAPASATTLARLATGLADDVLSCQALAFGSPLVIAPAMNPRMWENPATQANWETLRLRGHTLVAPEKGRVACMDEGTGRLADLRAIYLAVLRAVSQQDLAGRAVLVTLGPTREFWDGIRFWSNPSTGIMGAAIAVAAFLRGASVHAVCGPGTPWLPQGIARHNVVTARDMFAAASDLWPRMDAGVCTAAVADFSPKPWGEGKFKKAASPAGMDIAFVPNQDILHTLAGNRRPEQKLVGFAAETDMLEQRVHDKLRQKKVDLMVGNLVGKPDSGFAAPCNSVYALDAQGSNATWTAVPKPDLAWRILDWLLRL